MKSVLSALVIAITLAWAQPAVAGKKPSADALWVPFSSVTLEHVERFFEGEFSDVVLMIEEGDVFPLAFGVHGDILTTDGQAVIELRAQRALYIFVRGDKLNKEPLFSFDGKKWYRAKKLFTGSVDAQFHGAGAGVEFALFERD